MLEARLTVYPSEYQDRAGTEKDFKGCLQKGCVSCRDTPRPTLHVYMEIGSLHRGYSWERVGV